MTSGPTVRRPVSQGDVARHAGVSGQTVSRVANGLDNVQPETKRRVEQAMRELGYRPNGAARALRTGRFRSIGVVVSSLSSYGNVRTIEAIVSAAAAADHSVLLRSAAQRTTLNVSQALIRLDEQSVDGVIVLVESQSLDRIAISVPDDLPVVIVDSVGAPDHVLVDTDQAQGARLATEHLLDLGHPTVWHLAGPRGSYAAERREAAWEQALRGAGRSVPPVFRGDWTDTRGYELGRTIADRPDIGAVFVANDQMALGLLRACHENGRRVPESLSVVGFDDMQESASFWPPLTTVRQDFSAVGESAVASLLAAIQGERGPRQVTIPTRLVERSSTAPPVR